MGLSFIFVSNIIILLPHVKPKATTNKELLKTTVTATIDQTGYNSVKGTIDNYLKNKVQSMGINYTHNLLNNNTGVWDDCFKNKYYFYFMLDDFLFLFMYLELS